MQLRCIATRFTEGVTLGGSLFHVTKEVITLRIVAKQLQLRNLQELAATTVDGTTYMGRLDSVVSSLLGYDVVIGGHSITLDAGHPLEIRRTAISESLQLANELTEEYLDGLEAADAVA